MAEGKAKRVMAAAEMTKEKEDHRIKATREEWKHSTAEWP